MSPLARARAFTFARAFSLVLIAMLAATSAAAASTAARPLLHEHAKLADELTNSPFGRPLVMKSSEHDGTVQGEVHAELAQPFKPLAAALGQPQAWCDILILHPNVKECLASRRGAGMPVLTLKLGTKETEHDAVARRPPGGQASAGDEELRLRWRLGDSSSDHLRVRLSGKDGPMGTSDYRIELEAVPLPAGSSFLRLRYSYHNGLAAKLATQAYLSTAGRDKVGFSIVGHADDGAPQYVHGLRGLIERNTMRYYLAIAAYLKAQSAPADERPERRLQIWYEASETWPAQLHEEDGQAYLDKKREQIRRQGEAQQRLRTARNER